MSAGEDERGWLRPLAPLFLTVLVDVLALTLIFPLLPFLAQRYGASPTVVGLLFASFSICQLVSGPILGRLSDRLGRKPVLLASQAGTFVGLLLIGLGGSLELIFVGRMIDGLTAGNLTIAQAYIADVTPPQHRTKAFGLIGLAFGVGFLVGPAVSGVLGARLGFSAPPLAAAALSALSVLLTWRLLPAVKVAKPEHTVGRAAALGRFLRVPAARARLGEMFFYLASFSVLMGGLALFLERRFGFDVEKTGYVFAFAGLVGGLAQGGIGRAAARLGEARLSVAGLVLVAVGMAVLATATSLGQLALAVVIQSAGSSVVRPALTTLITGAVEDDERGLALGASQSLGSIAQTVGPLLAGALIQRGALAGWALTSAGLACVAVLVRAVRPVPHAGPARHAAAETPTENETGGPSDA